MNDKKIKTYATRINHVCNYISKHLDEDLTVEKLSQIANFSKFHFHRQFSEYTGVNVAKYILMMRLKRASYQLVYNKYLLIINIALEAKFENPESFSRAFKKAFRQTPSQFRQKPEWQSWNEKYEPAPNIRNLTVKVNIVELPGIKVAVLEHRKAPELINNSVSTFIDWRKKSGLSPVATSNTYGVIYDDPKNTAPEKFRFDICGSEETDIPKNPQGVKSSTIPAGRCAQIRHLGAHEEMDKKIHFLYGEWLPNSGEELRDFPCFCHYLNFFPEVQEHALVTDIYLPLK